MCGGSGGSKHIITLQPGEHITTVEGQYGFVSTYYGSNSITELTFTTNRGITHGPYGILSRNRQKFCFKVPHGMGLVAIKSNDHTYVEDVTFYFEGKHHFVQCKVLDL